MRPFRLLCTGVFAGLVLASSVQLSSARSEELTLERMATLTPEQLNATDALAVYEAYESAGGEFEGDPIAYASSRIRRALAILYYPVDLSSSIDPREDRALREQVSAFQRTLNHEPDGTLSFGEFNRLLELETIGTATPIGFLWRRAPHVEADWAGAAGTWVIRGDQIAYPLNFAQIDCWRAAGHCEATEVHVDASDLSGVAGESGRYLAGARTTIYSIASWAAGKVEARSEPPAGECRFATLILDQSSGVVSEVSQDRSQHCDHTLLPPLRAPRTSTLEDPELVVRNYFAARYEEVERHQGPLAAQSYRRPFVARDLRLAQSD